MVYEGRADVARGLLGPALPWADGLRPAFDRTTPAVPEGNKITVATFSDRAELPEVAVLVAQSLAEAGVDVTQEVRQYAHIEADALAGAFNVFILSRATILDSGDPVAYMYSDFACDGSFNLSQLCDPAVDAALQHAAEALPGGRPPPRHHPGGTGHPCHRRGRALAARTGESGRGAGVADAARDPRERTLITEHTTLTE